MMASFDVSNLAIYDKAATSSSFRIDTLGRKWSSGGKVLLATLVCCWRDSFYVSPLLLPFRLPLDLRMMIGFISLRLALLEKKG